MIGWAHAAAVGAMQVADFQMEKADGPQAIGQGEEPQTFSCQSVPDEAPPAFPNDFPIGMDTSAGQRPGVSGWRPHLRWPDWFGAVKACGRLLVQSLMRPVVVIVVTPALKTLLLRRQAGGRRAQRVGFQNAMMLFMGRILFRMAFGVNST
jgi:hypothetical protein